MTEEPKDIFESIDKLTELNMKHNTLLKELKRALRIAELLGIPAKELKGKVGFSVAYLGGCTIRPWKDTVVRVRHEGEVKEYPLMNVHHDLWPQDILDAYERDRRRQQQAKLRHAAMRGEDLQ